MNARGVANRIGAYFAGQSIPVTIGVPVRSAQTLTFPLRLANPSHLAKALSHDEALALALNVRSVRLGRTLGTVQCEVALPEDAFRPLALTERVTGDKLPVGQSTLGERVDVSLSSPITPHALVAGSTGSGKSVLLRTLVTDVARAYDCSDTRLLLIDGKANTFVPFARLPHLLHPVITDVGEAVRVLAWLLAEVDRRKGGGGASGRVICVIDEVAELASQSQAVAPMLARVAALGRELRVHAIVATQHPSAKQLSAVIRANLPLRVTGRVTDAHASALATGQSGLSAHRLLGRGDMLVVAQHAQRVQVAMVNERQLRALPRTGHVGKLELGATADGALDATGSAQLNAGHVAYAMAHGQGIQRTRRALGVGTDKARQVVRYAREVSSSLHELGYCVVECGK